MNISKTDENDIDEISSNRYNYMNVKNIQIENT